jgi:hypothetical protein
VRADLYNLIELCTVQYSTGIAERWHLQLKEMADGKTGKVKHLHLQRPHCHRHPRHPKYCPRRYDIFISYSEHLINNRLNRGNTLKTSFLYF